LKRLRVSISILIPIQTSVLYAPARKPLHKTENGAQFGIPLERLSISIVIVSEITSRINEVFIPSSPILFVMNNNLPRRNDEGPGFERLLRWIDDDDHRFNGHVRLGFNNCVLSDRGAQRLGQSLLGATARGCPLFHSISICPYYMTANAFQYWALLDFLATGQYRHVGLQQHNETRNAPEQPGMAAAMEHMLTAMIANQQPDYLVISGLNLTIPVLRLVLQCRGAHLSLYDSPLQQQLLAVVPSNDMADRDDHPAAAAAAAAALRTIPERGTNLSLATHNGIWFNMLQAATTLQTNVASLRLCFAHPMIVGRFDFSILTGFLTSQPNSVHLNLNFSLIDAVDAIVEHIFADVLTQCPDVYALSIRVDDPPSLCLLFNERFARLTELVSNTALKRFVVDPPTALSPEQLEQISVITERNRAIPAYLEATGLLKQRRPPTENDPIDPPIMVYDANGAEDRPKYLFVLSHALSQAAVHPIFFSHFYQYVRNNADELFGLEGRQALAAATAPPPPPP
jgi:hypothetical protein